MLRSVPKRPRCERLVPVDVPGCIHVLWQCTRDAVRQVPGTPFWACDGECSTAPGAATGMRHGWRLKVLDGVQAA